ncbi:baseplate J/gp47 family protein [Pseudoflavonifractor phocaeensis]|uniref:baseplate J/gp47 family protein n=1 Tax=Pseudoflavonifractor phocaeensis TaxID=1870988 RepID=UPI00195E4F15|nr:baseplate J/gp47 family protein [Pseudoflavonifractor phocaeensis]
MIDFSQDTYQNLLQAMLAQVPSTYDKRDTAPIPTALGPAAWVLEGFYLILNQVQRQAFVQTAVGEALDMLAVLGGITRNQASAAVMLGVFNEAVPIGARFSTINGASSINFTVTAATETEYQYQLTAETPGTIGNEYTGPILPITVISGLTSAQLTEILVPGDNVESDDALRTRLINALNDRPFGGNIAAYRENILAIDGVGAVQVYPTWNGGGTVACSILGSDYLPASEELIQTVQTAIDPPTSGLGLGLAPIGAQVTITTPTELTVNVSATLQLSPGYEIGQVQAPIEAAIEAYLLTVRQSWATNTSTSDVTYAANVYVARITAAILSVTGVVNATNVQLNGGAADLTLTQTGASQQVPILGTVTLSE